MKLRCYCCGEDIDGVIALVTMSPMAVDRVFVLNADHLENLDAATTHSLLVTPFLPGAATQ